MFKFDYRTDTTGRVTHLFFAHPKSIELLAKYPEVLLLDCTYRTNKFKMPLLNIVGTTCLNKNYHVAFCFLAKEEEEDYVWALKQLQDLLATNASIHVLVTDRELALINACRQIFPEAAWLLCIWHIEKNILTHAAEFFEKGIARDTFIKAWTKVVHSTSIQAYEDNWNEFQNEYSATAPGLVQYIKDTWIVLWKRSMIQAYTNKVLHLGNRVTSRVEGAHNTIKSYLQCSTGDLKAVYDSINLLLANQHASYEAEIALNKSRSPHTALE